MEHKAITALKQAYNSLTVSDTGRRTYPKEFKQLFVDTHYEVGCSMYKLEQIMGMTENTTESWKNTLGKDQTAYIHGKTTRHDVRTKCLAVKEHLEDKRSQVDIASKYNVATNTIYNWIRKYKNTYKRYIEKLPDGVSAIKEESKLIYGQKNIQLIREQLEKNHQAIQELLSKMKLTTTEKNIIKKIDSKNKKDMEELETMTKIADKLGINLK